MRAFGTAVLYGLDVVVLVYFVVLNTTYLVLTLLAALDVTRSIRRAPFAGFDEIFANPLTPPVSVIVAAYNEASGIRESVAALLSLRYPEFEVLVVEDGSTDGTFEVLADAFDLVEVDSVEPRDVPTVGAVRSVHVARDGKPLTVIRKDNAGRRADPSNVGINFARYPLVCVVDADSVLDGDALLRVAKPFVDDPLRVIAAGGVVRAANGCTVQRGRVVDVRMPHRWLARIQVVEYLRSFLLGRSGWSRLSGLLIISGAFGLFRRDLLVRVGGFDLACIGEDAELVARLHRRLRADRRDYRIVFVAEPVCWTEVPEHLSVLARQRRRWARGLAETLWKHRRMVVNRRYGRIGMLALPYHLAFELFGPLVEVGGVFAVAAGFALGVVDVPFAVLFALVAVGYGVLLSVLALLIEEFSFHRFPRWRDLLIGVLAAVLENVGYRQLHALWRLQGLIAAVAGKHHPWGVMSRSGFRGHPAPARR